MNIKLLKQVCAVPTVTYHEEAMVRFLMDLIQQGGEARYGRCWSDAHRNVFVVKGQAPRLPCVAAHIDTVQPLRKVQVVDQGDILTAEFGGAQVGFGADDKTGVFACLELLQRFDNMAVAFFAGEEQGCIGARHADLSFFDRLGYMIEFDCPSRGLFSYTNSGERLFENDGAFIRTALPVLQQHDWLEWQRHPYTDVMAVRQRTRLSCMNVASGYYNWHRDDEYIRLSDTAACLDMAVDLIQTLGTRPYLWHRNRQDDVPPLVEIKPLSVVDKALMG